MMQLQRTAAKQRETGGNLASTRVLGLRGMQEQVLREVRWYSFGQAKRRGSKERLQKKHLLFLSLWWWWSIWWWQRWQASDGQWHSSSGASHRGLAETSISRLRPTVWPAADDDDEDDNVHHWKRDSTTSKGSAVWEVGEKTEKASPLRISHFFLCLHFSLLAIKQRQWQCLLAGEEKCKQRKKWLILGGVGLLTNWIVLWDLNLPMLTKLTGNLMQLRW